MNNERNIEPFATDFLPSEPLKSSAKSLVEGLYLQNRLRRQWSGQPLVTEATLVRVLTGAQQGIQPDVTDALALCHEILELWKLVGVDRYHAISEISRKMASKEGLTPRRIAHENPRESTLDGTPLALANFEWLVSLNPGVSPDRTAMFASNLDETLRLALHTTDERRYSVDPNTSNDA